MKNGLLILATLAVLSGCGGDNSGDCAADTKVVHVKDSSANRDSYHFFRNTCNDLTYTGNFNSENIWGYKTNLPYTGYWSHNMQTYQLKRTANSFNLSASLPRLPDNDEKSQGALVCTIDISVDGFYDETRVDIGGYDIKKLCYQKNNEQPIIAQYNIDYETLTKSEVAKLTSIVLQGNPTKSDFTKAMSSDKLMLCNVASDEEIEKTECAK
ncbi:hypothetical protein ACSL9C_000863 [Vibrio navarrensis]